LFLIRYWTNKRTCIRNTKF